MLYLELGSFLLTWQHECDSYVTFMALDITTILASNAKLLLLFIYFTKSIFSRLSIPTLVHLLSFLAFFLCNKSQIEYPTFMFLSVSGHMFFLMCIFEPLFMVLKNWSFENIVQYVYLYIIFFEQPYIELVNSYSNGEIAELESNIQTNKENFKRVSFLPYTIHSVLCFG